MINYQLIPSPLPPAQLCHCAGDLCNSPAKDTEVFSHTTEVPTTAATTTAGEGGEGGEGEGSEGGAGEGEATMTTNNADIGKLVTLRKTTGDNSSQE